MEDEEGEKGKKERKEGGGGGERERENFFRIAASSGRWETGKLANYSPPRLL